MISAILDTGALVGWLDEDDQWHPFASMHYPRIRSPAFTCDAVIAEACFQLNDVPDGRDRLLEMVQAGALHVLPMLPEESTAVRALLRSYGKRMDYADACLVRLSEIHRHHVIVTTDAKDFRVYRRFRREPLPLLTP